MFPLKSWREWLQIFLFLGVYWLLHSAYFRLPDDVLRDVVYYHGLGAISAQLIHLLAPLEQVSAVQNHLLSPRADLEIVRGCDGAGTLFLMIAAISAYPASVKRKLIGLLFGVLLMYSLNLARISGLYFVIAYHHDWFQLIHTYFAPTLIIAVASLFFAWWSFGASRTIHESR